MFRAHLFGGPSRGQVVELDHDPGHTLCVAPSLSMLDPDPRVLPVERYHRGPLRDGQAAAFLWAAHHWSQADRDQLADLVEDLTHDPEAAG